jgi:cell wall-associated NlpC family hydrolase
MPALGGRDKGGPSRGRRAGTQGQRFRGPGQRFRGPGQRFRGATGLLWRLRGPLLGVATTLLIVAAGWPAGNGTTAGLQSGPAGSVPAASAAVMGSAQGQLAAGPAMIPGGSVALPPVAPLRQLLPVDLLVVSRGSLPSTVTSALLQLHGVRAAQAVDAARLQVNGKDTNVLGVDPSAFRRFAAKPTASRTTLWRSVAGGDIALSYTMGRLDNLPAGSVVTVAGRQIETLQVGGLGTVGIAGIDAVVSHSVARSLGFPVNNAIIVSAPHASLPALERRIKAVVPRTAVVEQLVSPSAAVAAGSSGVTTGPGGARLLTGIQVTAFLRAALSRVGMPYVWGAAGPTAFDCSGLVQWSFAQAGVVMPRVAADQARTGPAVTLSQLTPGDLLFYHTDPTAPGYISHVAIYLGSGRMIQAPQPGMNVEIVPVDLGSEYAGAVAVSPAIAAAAAASPVG